MTTLGTVLDAHGDAWRTMSGPRRDIIRGWLLEHGTDPSRIFTVRLLSENLIEVEQYVRRADGILSPHPTTPDAPWTERVTVPVGRLPDVCPL